MSITAHSISHCHSGFPTQLGPRVAIQLNSVKSRDPCISEMPSITKGVCHRRDTCWLHDVRRPPRVAYTSQQTATRRPPCLRPYVALCIVVSSVYDRRDLSGRGTIGQSDTVWCRNGPSVNVVSEITGFITRQLSSSRDIRNTDVVLPVMSIDTAYNGRDGTQ